MKEKRYVLTRVNVRDIQKPIFFDTYEEAFEEMKKQYEMISWKDIGELNDDDAWCMINDSKIDWKIFDVEWR